MNPVAVTEILAQTDALRRRTTQYFADVIKSVTKECEEQLKQERESITAGNDAALAKLHMALSCGDTVVTAALRRARQLASMLIDVAMNAANAIVEAPIVSETGMVEVSTHHIHHVSHC